MAYYTYKGGPMWVTNSFHSCMQDTTLHHQIFCSFCTAINLILFSMYWKRYMDRSAPVFLSCCSFTMKMKLGNIPQSKLRSYKHRVDDEEVSNPGFARKLTTVACTGYGFSSERVFEICYLTGT